MNGEIKNVDRREKSLSTPDLRNDRAYAVSSSSPHLGHIGSVRIFVTVWCVFKATWPVSRPARIRKCFLLRPRAKRASHLSGPCRNIFACRQPAVDFQRLSWSVWAQARIVFWAVLLEILSTGSGPMNSDVAACLASSSAISFLGTLLCPGTQSKRMLLTARPTRLDLVLAESICMGIHEMYIQVFVH